MLKALAQLLIASIAALLPRKDPTIAVEFCKKQDHMVIVIDGAQADFINQRPRGILGLFELWATEDEIRDWLGNLLTTKKVNIPNLLASVAVDQRAVNLVVRMSRDPIFAARLTIGVLAQVRAFRDNEYVRAQMARELRMRRLQDTLAMAVLVHVLTGRRLGDDLFFEDP